MARLDQNRPGKGSNRDWRNPHDPDARITKMKDGRTHLAHKSEHAVDMETGAVLAVTLQGADLGDTTTIHETLGQAQDNIRIVARNRRRKNKLKPMREIVADKGYPSNAVLRTLHEEHGLMTCISEPDRGRRKWEDKRAEQHAVYKNRLRIKSKKGIARRKRRGEIGERTFAHCYETGAMRRTHLRKHDNILKRLFIHTSALNLSLLFRQTIGTGTPRRLWDALKTRAQTLAAASHRLIQTIHRLRWNTAAPVTITTREQIRSPHCRLAAAQVRATHGNLAFTTGC